MLWNKAVLFIDSVSKEICAMHKFIDVFSDFARFLSLEETTADWYLMSQPARLIPDSKHHKLQNDPSV